MKEQAKHWKASEVFPHLKWIANWHNLRLNRLNDYNTAMELWRAQVN